jgi:hypothetical protein
MSSNSRKTSNATTAHTAEDDARARADLADLAAQFIEGALAHGVGHRPLMEALLTAYVAVAETHACCTAGAAAAALRCGERLMRAAEHGPAATHLH